MTTINNIKTANLRPYSNFIKPRETLTKLPKETKRSRNIITIIAAPSMSDETYIKHVKLRERLDAVKAECTKRKLKFIAQAFAYESVSEALKSVEKELGIEPKE